ncbi:helix-turn-helix domain-containing protein [Mogibacterium timidum]
MTKVRKDEPVHLHILIRICNVLDCSFGDIVD